METGTREDWPVLLRAADDRRPEVAIVAVEGLGRLAGPGDVAELLLIASRHKGRRAREARLWAERIERRSSDPIVPKQGTGSAEQRVVLKTGLSRLEAEEGASQRNAQLGADGDRNRYSIAVEDQRTGAWSIEERKENVGKLRTFWRAWLDS